MGIYTALYRILEHLALLYLVPFLFDSVRLIGVRACILILLGLLFALFHLLKNKLVAFDATQFRVGAVLSKVVILDGFGHIGKGLRTFLV